MNSYIWAILTAVCFGFVLLPWSYVIKTVGSGPLFVAMGVTFLLTGIGMLRGGTQVITPTMLFWVAVVGASYPGIIWLMNQAYGTATQASLPVVASVINTYVIVTLLANWVIYGSKAMPSAIELAAMLVIFGGIIVLSLFGRH